MALMIEPMDDALAAWEQVLTELESPGYVDPPEGSGDAGAVGTGDVGTGDDGAVGTGDDGGVGTGDDGAVGTGDDGAVGTGDAGVVGTGDADAVGTGDADAFGRAGAVGRGVGVGRAAGVPTAARVGVAVGGLKMYAGCASRGAGGEEDDGVACLPPKPASTNGARFGGCPAMAAARSATRFTSASSGRKAVRARTAIVTQAAPTAATISLGPRRVACPSSRSRKLSGPGAASGT
jgi:hypothetical protein